MSMLTISSHAAVRMSQRGIIPKDAELIVLIGSEIDDGYMVREKDYRLAESELKRLLQRIQRLIGKRLVVKNGQLVTAYHSSRIRQRRLLRSARAGNLCDQ